MKWVDGITDLMDMSLSKLWKIVKESKAWCAPVHGVAKSQTQLSDWTTKILILPYLNSLLMNCSAFLTCFATGSVPTLPPTPKNGPFSKHEHLLRPPSLQTLSPLRLKYKVLDSSILLMRRMLGSGWRLWQPGHEWEGGSQTLRYRFRSCDLTLFQICNYHFTWSGNDRASLRS